LRALVQAPQGYPAQISAWSANQSVHGKVVQLAGPWRTSGDWWLSDRWARDEWDVAVASGVEVKNVGGHTDPPLQVLYRIYRELHSDSWFVEGIYD
jgi:protein ImuB